MSVIGHLIFKIEQISVVNEEFLPIIIGIEIADRKSMNKIIWRNYV